jgi:hypothetical protein
MVRVAALMLLLLAGCMQESPGRKARHRYLMMIQSKAPREDMCAEARRDAEAALNDSDETEYKSWLQMEKQDCEPRPS